jgi:hypothetical protein
MAATVQMTPRTPRASVGTSRGTLLTLSPGADSDWSSDSSWSGDDNVTWSRSTDGSNASGTGASSARSKGTAASTESSEASSSAPKAARRRGTTAKALPFTSSARVTPRRKAAPSPAHPRPARSALLTSGAGKRASSPSPSPRSATFASLSRMRFTRDSVRAMMRYLELGATPDGWGRARAWKFVRRMRRYTWRTVAKPRRRWAPLVPAVQRDLLDAPAGADARPSASNARDGPSASTAASTQGQAAGTLRAGSLAAGADGNDGAAAEAVLEVRPADPSADGRVEPSLVWLEVVAEEDVPAALHALYIDPAQGSLRGAKALYERALQRYVGVTMRAVLDFLAHQETRQAVQARQGYLILQPADVSEPGHWQADVTDVGVFTTGQAKHMVVAVDMFTKYAWAFPLDSKHAAGIVAALERAFLQEEPPLTLRTDGGGDMTNVDSTALCARYSVERRVCAPYNSQCNGGVERLHATLKAALSKHTHEWLSTSGSVDWVTLLPHVLYAYNTSVHAATGLTPFPLQRGRAPRPLGPLLLEHREGAPLAGPSLYGSVCAVPSAAAEALRCQRRGRPCAGAAECGRDVGKGASHNGGVWPGPFDSALCRACHSGSHARACGRG